MESRERTGIYYSNPTWGISREAHQLNSHFFPEGKERRVWFDGEPAVQLGWIDPTDKSDAQGILLTKKNPTTLINVHISRIEVL
jgi:hypothetical protein